MKELTPDEYAYVIEADDIDEQLARMIALMFDDTELMLLYGLLNGFSFN